MKRVGIITHYYNSNNYGGVLQAYALCRVLREEGYDCEQICYDSSSKDNNKKTLKQVIARCIALILFDKKWKKRRVAMSSFREQVAHSEVVYTSETIELCANEYDVFVAGSDQVWNLKAYHPAYFLDFVPSNKCKISYAASLCANHFEVNEKELLKKSLYDYKAISVREKDAVNLLSPLTEQSVKWTVDPVFLLNAAQWKVICTERIVKNDYLFCYFLGNDRTERNLARQYAKKNGLKLVTIPYINQNVSKNSIADFCFGDIRLNDISPGQFVSLIKNANVIFTDSFHAVAFSIIYKKEFYVFERENEKQMGTRINSIVELVDAQERFCVGENLNLDYLLSCSPINYEKNQEIIESLKYESLHFLKDNMG